MWVMSGFDLGQILPNVWTAPFKQIKIFIMTLFSSLVSGYVGLMYIAY